MNTILRSKMEREIEPNWGCDYGGLIRRPYARVLAVDNGDVVFRRDNDPPVTLPLRDITYVRPPGGEWLEVVDDPSITPATPSTSSVHNETELEGGTRRLAEIIGEGNGWKVVMGHDGAESYVIGERTDNGTHWVKWDYYYYGNRCGAYLQMPEPVGYKLPPTVTITSATSPDGTTYRVDGLRVFVTPTVKDPLSWDANPPMVGDFVQDKDGHRMMITTQYSDGKVVVGEYDSDPIELSRDELKQKGYVRLALSPLHKEAKR